MGVEAHDRTGPARAEDAGGIQRSRGAGRWGVGGEVHSEMYSGTATMVAPAGGPGGIIEFSPPPTGHPRFHEILAEVQALHDKKNHGYAYGGDPLGNFARVDAITALYPFFSQPTSQGALRVAIVYMLKQLDAALWLLSQGHESEEGVVERLRDVQVYSVLAQILYEEAAGERTDDDPTDFIQDMGAPAYQGLEVCPECGDVRPDDDRVKAGMKCGYCAYGGG